MAAVLPLAKYISEPLAISDTTEHTVFTVPDGRWAYLTNLWAATNDGSASTLRIVLYKDSASTSFALGHNVVIPANAPLSLEFMPIALQQGDEIRVKGGGATIHVICTFVDDGRSGT